MFKITCFSHQEQAAMAEASQNTSGLCASMCPLNMFVALQFQHGSQAILRHLV